MSLSFDAEGQTPLDEEDLDGLLPAWVTTRADLDEVEQAGIARARDRWLRPIGRPSILDDVALRRLHMDMFGDVWEWAGVYRLRDTSIGIDPKAIALAIRNLVDDAELWVRADPQAGVARLHHRLVAIHPFRTGNGRHGRLAADVLAIQAGLDLPKWTGGRDSYLAALRTADGDDTVDALIAFMWGPAA